MALEEKNNPTDKVDVPGFEGRYAVTRCGKVWSHSKGTNAKSGKWMRQDCSGRYPRVSFMVEGSKHKQSVHRLVALAFIPNPNGFDQVNHINGDRSDNRVENLEWCSGKTNRKHAWETGLQTATDEHRKSAARQGIQRRLFSMEQAKDIRRLYEVAKLSQYQIADLFDTSQAVINGIVNYKTYTKEAA